MPGITPLGLTTRGQKWTAMDQCSDVNACQKAHSELESSKRNTNKSKKINCFLRKRGLLNFPTKLSDTILIRASYLISEFRYSDAWRRYCLLYKQCWTQPRKFLTSVEWKENYSSIQNIISEIWRRIITLYQFRPRQWTYKSMNVPAVWRLSLN
jgi:hypothetical protein